MQLRFTKKGIAAPGTNQLDSWLAMNVNNFSEWSTVCLIRGISQPSLSIDGVANDRGEMAWSLANTVVVGKLSFINADETDTLKTYQEFIHYLSVKAIGNKNYIIEAFDNNEHNQFIGYVKVNKLIVDNKLLLEFEVDGCKLKAEWQAGDNYAVWQQCGICGDDYSGYLLFPTYNNDEYFCLWYKC